MSRISVGKRTIQTYADSDRLYSSRYLDPTAKNVTMDPSVAMYEDQLAGTTVEAGVPNSFLINVNTKLAAVGVNDPDFHILSRDEDVPPLVRSWLRRVWIQQDITRALNKAEQKWFICGMGIVRYMWDEVRRVPDVEHVQTWQFFHDPNVKSWKKLRWAGCCFSMSREDAKEYYKDTDFEADPTKGDTESVVIDMYWDEVVEAHVWNGKVLKRVPNLYRRPPFLVLEGDANPNPSRYPIGDGRTTAGVCALLANMYKMLANTATNGGPITFVNKNLVDETAERSLEMAIEQGVVPVVDNPDNVFARISSEALSPAVLEANASMQRALDASMGVTAFQRGQTVDRANTATETMTVVQQSGARGVEARVKLERFLDDLAGVFVQMQDWFGGPDNAAEDYHPMETIIWQACRMVDEVHVVEGSTVFRDPNMDQQQAMLLFNLALGAAPVMAQATGKMPNIEKLFTDVLTSFGRRDTSMYILDAPQPAPSAQMEAPGMPAEQQPAPEVAPAEETLNA